MKRHDLKCHPHFFDALQRGDLPFTIRRNDRHYQVGDVLCIRKYDPAYGIIPGEDALLFAVTYVMTDEDFPAIAAGFVVMGLKAWFPFPGDEKDAAIINDLPKPIAEVSGRCKNVLKAQGKPYPRTCPVHGLGPCP